jgi:hypothetical protein
MPNCGAIVNIYGRAGIGEVGIRKVVQRIFGEHVSLAGGVQVDVVAKLA